MKKASAVALIVVLLSACSVDDGGLPNERRSGADSLATYLDLPVTPEEWVAAELVSEEAIAGCMAEQGFTYAPFPVVVGSQAAAIGGLIPETAEFFEVYGFGHSTTLFPSSELPDDIIGFPGSETDREAPDPNREQIESLPVGESMTYEITLYGEFDAEGNTVTPGCVEAGREKGVLFTDDGIDALDLWQRFRSEVSENVASSDEWQSYVTEMKGCLSTDGFAEAADALDVMVSDPLVQYPLNEYVANAVDPQVELDLDSHARDGFAGLRKAQGLEMGVAGVAVSCGWRERDARYLEIAEPFEEEVWLSMEGEIAAAREQLDEAGWSDDVFES